MMVAATSTPVWAVRPEKKPALGRVSIVTTLLSLCAPEEGRPHPFRTTRKSSFRTIHSRHGRWRTSPAPDRCAVQSHNGGDQARPPATAGHRWSASGATFWNPTGTTVPICRWPGRSVGPRRGGRSTCYDRELDRDGESRQARVPELLVSEHSGVATVTGFGHVGGGQAVSTRPHLIVVMGTCI